MATPVWTTTAGKLASIDEQSAFSLQLEANTSDSTAIVYSLIAGSLPTGMSITSEGLLTGTPAEVAKRTLYTFVVRATAGSAITDRTFTLDVAGADAPSFTTVAGQLNKPLSTVYTADSSSTTDSTLSTADVTGNVTVLDGSYIEYDIVATDTDTAAGQNLVYEVVQGSLPPGVTMTLNGKISGVVELAIDESYGPQGGYDFDAFPDYSALTPSDGGSPTAPKNIYDRTVFSKSRSVNYDFIVRVTDGVSSVDRNFNIFVYSADFWIVSNSNVTIDQTLIGDNAVTMDLHTGRPPVFTTESDLGTFRHDNKVLIRIDVSDFDPLQANLEYSITAGALPPGLSIDLNSGELYGSLATQAAVEVDYTFTVRANRVVATGLNTFSERTFTMKVVGEINIGISFSTPDIIGTLTAGIPSILSIETVDEEPNRVLSYTVTSGSLPTGITLSDAGNLIGTIDPSDFTDSTRAFTFEVTVSDQYQTAATSKEFTLNIDIPYTQTEYGNMSGHATSFIDKNLFYNISQDPNINSPEYIYRPEDPTFGMKNKPDMLLTGRTGSTDTDSIPTTDGTEPCTKRLCTLEI
jgi:large repetitive protein